MEIKVKGVDERKKRYIISKVEKYIKILRIKSASKECTINVKILKKSRGMNAREDYGVYIVNSAKRTNSPIAKDHTIIINYDILKKRRIFLQTLFHELVHLRQYLTKKLIYLKTMESKPYIAVWKKKKLGDLEKIPYSKQPWEIEARSLEKKLWTEGKL